MIQEIGTTDESRRMTRYALTIVFEEQVTQNEAELRLAADAIGDVITLIEHHITHDQVLRKLLTANNLTMELIAPVRNSVLRVLPQ